MAKRPTFRPSVETLEDRLALSTLVADYDAHGVWRHSDAGGWEQLTTHDPQAIAVDDYGTVFGDFGGHGIWSHSDAGGWLLISTANPEAIHAAGDGVLVGDFGRHGAWRHSADSGWEQVFTGNPQGLALCDDGTAFGDFGRHGIWAFVDNVGWEQVSWADPEAIAATGDGVLLADFGPSGLWRHTDFAGINSPCPTPASSPWERALWSTLISSAACGATPRIMAGSSCTNSMRPNWRRPKRAWSLPTFSMTTAVGFGDTRPCRIAGA
jgi:hypothetical protein